jgi:opacity protein-like surface antigen
MRAITMFCQPKDETAAPALGRSLPAALPGWLVLSPALLLQALALPAQSAEWTRDLGLALGSYYSDNICRAPFDEEGKVVGTVTPRVNLRGEGDRANLVLDAAVEYNTLGESSLECPQGIGGGFGNQIENRETWVPRVNFAGEVEAIENLFFLEADAYAAQNPFNPFAAGGDDNINATGNSNITSRWGVGGRIDRRLNEQWSALLRYNYNEQYNSINQFLGDSQEDRVELNVGMIPGSARFTVALAGQYSEIDFDETLQRPALTNRLSRLELKTGLQLTRSWQVNASGGQEDNVFVSASDDIDGSFWDVGLRWAPNTRIDVNVGYGERFFGEAPRFDIAYRHKRTEFVASYLRDIQFGRNIRGSSGTLVPDDLFGPDPGLPGAPLPGAGDPTFIGQGPVLNERFSLRYRFTARRTTFAIQALDSQQTRQADGGTGSFRNVTATFTRTLGSSVSADLQVGWRNNEGDLAFGGGGLFAQNLEAWTAGVGLRKNLANDVILSLRYRYTDQTSENTFNTFEENRVELGLRFGL